MPKQELLTDPQESAVTSLRSGESVMKMHLLACALLPPFIAGCWPNSIKNPPPQPVSLDLVPVADVIKAVKLEVGKIGGFNYKPKNPGACHAALKGYPAKATLSLKTVGTTTVNGGLSGTAPIGYVLKASFGATGSHAEANTQSVTVDLAFKDADFPAPKEAVLLTPPDGPKVAVPMVGDLSLLARSTLVAILNANHDTLPCTLVSDVKVEADFQVVNDIGGTATLDFVIIKGNAGVDRKRDDTQSVSITLTGYGKDAPLGPTPP